MVNTHFTAALERCRQEKYQEAIPFFDLSIQLEPLHIESFFNRGLAYFKLGNFNQAIEDYTHALLLAPSNAFILSERAVAYHHVQNNRAALADFDQAALLEPQNPYRFSSRAYLKAFIGDVQGAVEDYKTAIQLDPDDAIALNNLGLLEEKLGYQQDAQAHFDQADAIADKGKKFEKPDLEQILQEYEAKQATQKETERLQAQPKGIIEKTTDLPKTHFEVMKQVFTSKARFKEFITFVKNTLKGKQ